jgi:tripartite ATP-independent transporter DctP family solute receptor
LRREIIMKKFLVLIFTILILISGCAKKEGKIVLKASDDHPFGYPTTEGLVYMKKIIEEKTGGRIKVEIYPSAQLGSEKETIENTQMGIIDINRVNCAPVSEFCKEIGVFGLPYIFRDEKHMWKVLDGPVGEKIAKYLEKYNLIGLAYYDSGARSFYNKKRPIYKPEDLKGLKIRVQKSRVMIETVETLGASATPMAFEEVYSSLQTGVIDGAENNIPSYQYTHHYEVAKYYSLDEHTRIPEIVLFSKKRWDTLSESDRKIILQAAKESEEYQKKLWKEYVNKSLNEIKKAGCKINTVDKKAFQEKVKPLYKKYEKEFGDLIKEIQNVK